VIIWLKKKRKKRKRKKRRRERKRRSILGRKKAKVFSKLFGRIGSLIFKN
jgi:hypothetical protein